MFNKEKNRLLDDVKKKFEMILKKDYGCDWVSIPRSNISKKGNLYITIVFPMTRTSLELFQDSIVTPQTGDDKKLVEEEALHEEM